MKILNEGEFVQKPDPWWVGGQISCDECGFKCELEAGDNVAWSSYQASVKCPTCESKIRVVRPITGMIMENVEPPRVYSRKPRPFSVPV